MIKIRRRPVSSRLVKFSTVQWSGSGRRSSTTQARRFQDEPKPIAHRDPGFSLPSDPSCQHCMQMHTVRTLYHKVRLSQRGTFDCFLRMVFPRLNHSERFLTSHSASCWVLEPWVTSRLLEALFAIMRGFRISNTFKGYGSTLFLMRAEHRKTSPPVSGDLELFKFNDKYPLDPGALLWSCNLPSPKNRYAIFRPPRPLMACSLRIGESSWCPKPASLSWLVPLGISRRIAISSGLIIRRGLQGSNGSAEACSGGVRWGSGREHTFHHAGIRARSYMGV